VTEQTTENSIKVRLVITSASVLPKVISDHLRVEPSKSWLRGDTVTPRATNVHKEHGWVLSVQGRSDEFFAERLIDQLIAMIPAGKVAELYEQNRGSIEVEISVIANISTESIPSISLSAAQVAFLAGCGGSFDVDLYLR
jgi:hypothetical protein